MLKYSIVALALVAGSSFAIADPNGGGQGGGGGPGGGAAMERSGGGGGMERAGPSGGSPGAAMKGGTTEGNGGPSDHSRAESKSDRSSASQERSGSMKRNSASDDHSGSMKKNSASEERSGKSDRNQAADENRGKDRDRQAADRDRDNDRADRGERHDKMRSEARDRDRNERGATGASEGAEGKARPKGSITGISEEQKTRVRSAFVSHRVAPARDIGVSVRVGAVVPRSVHFYPIPEDIVLIVPDYRGYEYFMIDESHVAIVDPDTLEVVDIIVVA